MSRDIIKEEKNNNNVTHPCFQIYKTGEIIIPYLLLTIHEEQPRIEQTQNYDFFTILTTLPTGNTLIKR